MKFKEVKTYQSIRFGKGEDNFFSLAKVAHKDLVMEAVSWGIRIRSESIGDDVVISFNNVAYAKMIEDKPASKKAV